MSDDLRERLHALADDALAENWHYDKVALAAYRMALDDAARATSGCVCYASAGDDGYNVAVSRCTAAVNALAEGL